MAGFRNEVVFADNVDFSGGSPVTGKITTDGQLLIGATASPNIRVGNIASAGSSLTVANSAGGIDISINAPVSVANGGTGATTLTGVLTGNGTSAISASAVTNHNLLVGAASNAITSVAPSATSGIPVISQGASADPAFGTAVVEGGGTGLTSTTAYAVLCGGTTATGNLQSIASVGTSGQVLTSNGAGALPTFQDASAGGLTWNEETGASVNAAVNNGYIVNNAGGVTVNLPATCAVGDVIRVAGKTGLWVVDAPAGDTVQIGDTATSSGGTLTATNAGDCLEIVCITADTTWRVISMIGNLTVA